MNEEVKQPEDNIVQKAERVRDEIKGLLEQQKQILARQEQLKAESILAGRSEAGIIAEKPKEETPAEYSKRIMRGGI